MVNFNELRISDDRNNLIVDCEIDKASAFSNKYIKKISIEYYKNASYASMPGPKSYEIYNNELDDDSVRNIRVLFNKSKLRQTEFDIDSFDDGLFYVIVCCEGDPSAQVMSLCGFDDNVEIGVILDWRRFYLLGMQYVAAMGNGCADKCTIPAGFEHFVLQWEALKLAIATCDWNLVRSLWEQFIHSPGSPVVSIKPAPSGCGCRS